MTDNKSEAVQNPFDDDQTHEIISGVLYLGGMTSAQDKAGLVARNVAHIVNCTLELSNFFPTLFTYKQIKIMDDHHVKICTSCT